MNNEPLKYRAISVVEGEIFCSPDIVQQDEGEIEIFEDNQEGCKVFAVFSSLNGRTLLKQLILEKIFYSKQDCRDFRVYAQEYIDRYFTRIKFLTGEYAATVDNSNQIDCPEGRYSFDEHGYGEGISDKLLIFLTRSDCERLCSTRGDVLDEHIKRYNFTVQLADAVLRLISLYGIAELIAYEKGFKKREEVNDFIKQHLQIDSLVSCTRHLVSHGVIAGTKTLPELIKALGLDNELEFIKFSRVDRKQMDLVEESSNKVAVKLKQYLESQFLEG